MIRFLSLAFMLFAFSTAHAQTPVLANTTIKTAKGDVSLVLEVAADPESRKLGLMNRRNIGIFQGMIFLFPKARDYEFWMSNTYIPLDMLFLDKDNRIVHIEHDVEPLTLKGRSANQLIKSVIELPAGTARDESIDVGNYVRYTTTQHVKVY